ncbi:unnamed protein product [Natator depressus]
MPTGFQQISRGEGDEVPREARPRVTSTLVLSVFTAVLGVPAVRLQHRCHKCPPKDHRGRTTMPPGWRGTARPSTRPRSPPSGPCRSPSSSIGGMISSFLVGVVSEWLGREAGHDHQ